MKNYIYTILYIISNGFSVIVINFVGNEIPIDNMIFLSSLYALIFFNFLNIKNLKSTYNKVFINKKLYINMIVVFMSMWIVCFIIPIYYTPAILMFYATAWPALFGAVKKYKEKKSRSPLILAVLIFIVILVLYINLSHVYSGVMYALLIIGTLIAGLTMFLYSKLSFDMNEVGFKPSEVLAIRYALLVIIPLVWSLKTGHLFNIDANTIKLSLVVGFFTLIIPIFFSQTSVMKVGVSNHTIAMGLTPFVSFVFEYFTHGYSVAVKTDGIYSLCLALVVGVGFYFILKSNVKTVGKY